MTSMQRVIARFNGSDTIHATFPVQEIRILPYLSYSLDLQGIHQYDLGKISKNDVYNTLVSHFYGYGKMFGSLESIPSVWQSPVNPKPLYKYFFVVDPDEALADPSQQELRDWTYGKVKVGRNYLMAVRNLDLGYRDVSFVMFVNPK